MLRENLPHTHPYKSWTDLAKSAAHRRASSAGQRTRLEDLLLPGHLKKHLLGHHDSLSEDQEL